MTTRRYLVHITKDDGSDWGASVPDLPGCVATGKSIDVVLERIRGAIELHLEGLREDGSEIPAPRTRTVTPGQSGRHIDVYATVEVAA
jgi:predicted RNase H-like HicB family nuclease